MEGTFLTLTVPCRKRIPYYSWEPRRINITEKKVCDAERSDSYKLLKYKRRRRSLSIVNFIYEVSSKFFAVDF